MKKEISKADLLARWKNREKKEVPSNAIPKAPAGETILLSNAQRRLWFLQDLNEGNSFYNYGQAYSLKGDWSIATLKKSIRSIYKTNDILRSYCFAGEEGVALKVNEDAQLIIKEIDFSHLSDFEVWNAAQKVVHEDCTASFDLTEAPLLRISIIKLAANYHILSVTMHHIITDQWSMEIFIKQLSTCYKSFCADEYFEMPKSEIQYSDFAHWDNAAEHDITALDYWRKKLSGSIPQLELQTDFKRPLKPSYKGSHKTIQFSELLSANVLKLARESQVTPFVLWLSIFKVVIHRYTGQKDLLIGSPIANRNQKELENLLGFFIDTLILRNSISPTDTFSEVLSKVQKSTLEAFSNKDVPFDVLVKELNPERSPNMNPFFQAMFVYNEDTPLPIFGKDLVIEKNDLVDLESSKFDLTLFVSENNGMVSASFEYATDLFQESTIEQFLKHIELVAQGVVANKKTPIEKITMLTDEELKLFFESSINSEVYKTKESNVGIHELIENKALETPNAVAITFKGRTMTYQELNDYSNSVASSILEATEGEHKIIGLCIGRSLEMIVGLLGILKSGSAYLPLDPEYPKERTKYILEDSNTELVLTEKQFTTIFDELSIPSLDIFSHEKSKRVDIGNLPKVLPEDLAYVIYTSGSTGKPKGVPISHKNIMSSTEARFAFYDESPSAFLLLSSISFDSSKAGIFWTLCNGGNLVIGEKRLEQDMVLMEETIVKNKISHLLTLPTLYGLMLEHINRKALQYLSTVIVAGETCSVQLPKQHFRTLQSTALYNEYGPTEATVWCIAHRIKADADYKSIPIGKAIEGVKIYLLDERLNHVPKGAVGEIYITGIGLSNGYLHNEELTETKFVSNPFSNNDGREKMYKSGDLGRYLSDGTIEFLGRADSQVKLRGFRIELDEIENTIRKHPKVQEAAVVITSKDTTKSNASSLLAAYVILKENFAKKDLLNFLKKQLPKHMVPAKIISIERFVTLPNGKIDRKYLQNSHIDTSKEENNLVEATTATEKKLVEIWEEILDVGNVSINDNFFDIGGDSIMTIQVIAKARKEGMAISPNQLFEYQTIAELASFVNKNNQKEDQWDYIVPLRKEGFKPPLFCIHAGGGHVFFYNKLTEYFDEDVPIYALQPSGLYGDKSMHKNVKNMAKAYLNSIRKVQSTGPYNILVYCFSAAVGNEMAILLAEMDEEINLIVMDTMTAPAVLNTPRRLRIRLAAFLIRLLKSPFATIKAMVIAKYSIWRMKWRNTHETDKEAQELERLRMNLMQLSQSYQWRPYSGKTSLILTKKDHEALNRETVRSWKELAKDDLNIIRTSGSHRVLFDEPFVKHTAEAIEKCMFE